MKKTLQPFVATPELRQFYKELGIWMRENNIPHKKLAVGYSVSLLDIPKEKSSEWIELSSFENWKLKNNIK